MNRDKTGDLAQVGLMIKTGELKEHPGLHFPARHLLSLLSTQGFDIALENPLRGIWHCIKILESTMENSSRKSLRQRLLEYTTIQHIECRLKSSEQVRVP